MILCPLTFACALLVFQHVRASATNRTIDDQNGDSVTGELPSYFPVEGWSQGNGCKQCFAQPNPAQTFDRTWHDRTISVVGPVDDLSITMSFIGTAVYAYFILDNHNTYTTFTNLTFSLDGNKVGSFSHAPDFSGSYVYDALAYSNTSIPNGNHTFVIHSPRALADALVLFDYVQYTYDPDLTITQNFTSPNQNPAPVSPHHSKNVAGPIAGGTIGGVLGLALISGVIFFLYRRRRRNHGINHAPPDASLLEAGSTAGILSQNLESSASVASPFIVSAASDGYRQHPTARKQQRDEISRQLEERQQQLMALQGAPSSRPPPSSVSMVQTTADTVHREPDPVLESQVEALRREVVRLREMMEVTGGEAPPQYHRDAR